MLGLLGGHRLVRIAYAEVVRRAGGRLRSGFAAPDASELRILGAAFRFAAMPRMRARAARPDWTGALFRYLAGIDVALVDAHLTAPLQMPGLSSQRRPPRDCSAEVWQFVSASAVAMMRSRCRAMPRRAARRDRR